jgi:hypothetical protein
VGNQQSLAQKSGVSNKQKVLIGVLAMLLVTILYAQYGRSLSGEAADEASGTLASRRPSRSLAANSAGQPAGEKADGQSAEFLIKTVDRREWKSPALSDVTRYDPFALPAAFPQPVVFAGPGLTTPEGVLIEDDGTVDADQRAAALAKVELKLAELQQRGVRVIIQGRKQATAVIGDRTVHVGDDVDGFTVKAIQADGVVVERKLD